MKIAWSGMVTNGASISSYTIQIKQGNTATYSTQTTHCDGTQTSIVTQAFCVIPMNIFTAAPFNYA